MNQSPYYNVPQAEWRSITERLIEEHPLKTKEIVNVVLKSWKDIFESKIGGQFLIGKHIFPKPQIMGFLLHELIPLHLQNIKPNLWHCDVQAADKDLVCVGNPKYSVEIKTSSDKSQIFGNRSFAEGSTTKGKKAKSGYYLCLNFEKFSDDGNKPEITLVRFGWIDVTDWIGQKASTGQQSRLPREVYDGKFQILYQK